MLEIHVIFQYILLLDIELNNKINDESFDQTTTNHQFQLQT